MSTKSITPNLINDSRIVCTNCGTVNGYLAANEFVDFYENMYRIRKKSIHHRKYHISNIIDDITPKNKTQISYNDRGKILRIFALIACHSNIAFSSNYIFTNFNP